MTDHMKPSIWGIAYRCVAALMIAGFLTVVMGIDPTTLAMN
ncbi:MAG TPA: hypothetical protein VLN61_11895 [Pseudolabrys sp.]|nr:hypothetical protein [Pseudolabrys sp.]